MSTTLFLLFFGQRALSLLRASRVIGCTAKFWLFWLVKSDVNVYRNMAFVMAWRSKPRIDFVIVSIKLWSCFLKLKSTFNPKPEILTQITPSFFTRIFRGKHYQQYSTVTRMKVSRLEGVTDKYSSGTVTHQLERWKDRELREVCLKISSDILVTDVVALPCLAPSQSSWLYYADIPSNTLTLASFLHQTYPLLYRDLLPKGFYRV